MKAEKKEIPKKVSSGDHRIDSLVSKAFKKGKYKPASDRENKLKELEDKSGVLFNSGQTELKSIWDSANILQNLSKILLSYKQSH